MKAKLPQGLGLSVHQAMLCNAEFRTAKTPAEQDRINKHYALAEDMNSFFPQLRSEWLFTPPEWLMKYVNC